MAFPATTPLISAGVALTAGAGSVKVPTTAQASRQAIRWFNSGPDIAYRVTSAGVTSGGIPLNPGDYTDWCPCSGDYFFYSPAAGSGSTGGGATVIPEEMA